MRQYENGYQDEKCYACGKRFRLNSYNVIPYHPYVLTFDGQKQFVGSDCYRRIQESESKGYQPPRGGPRLWVELYAPAEALLAAGITLNRT